MKTVTININGKETEITLTKEQLEQINKNDNPMLEVYKYHGATEEEFDKLYENLPKHVKAFEKECMVVAFYNKGWKPNWNDLDEDKYYPWFYLGKDFRLLSSGHDFSGATVSSRLCFRRKEDCGEAVEKFFEVYRESRNN
jgi:hypothetical protein